MEQTDDLTALWLHLQEKTRQLSRRSLEESALLTVDKVSCSLPERLRLPFECVSFYLLFHLYLAAALCSAGYLFLSRHYAGNLEWMPPLQEKILLWLLIAYHGAASFLLRSTLDQEEDIVSEENLAVGLAQQQFEEEMELETALSESSGSSEVKTDDLLFEPEDWQQVGDDDLDLLIDEDDLQGISLREM